ncbi:MULTISPECIES: methyltransferase [Streptomyces]|uniref:Methyltransferase domain-containing protein n=1 Tax=Streptomyces tsukubensis (strain DSM 42081 / NBRC 108919 / NRRL 18488 / 9993) TaxID=1114943 RepID=A0A7G3UAQ1_STRT9|nr:MULTISPECIES: methyltransferase [Streptomyces]AZK97624.1 methyltransferase [Streptomyces tsukubensis]MYS66159.1 methyltransferase [Streptomyces sp. SID5473]QKM66435.1 methyltransferase domain-containing protein [Streptomyces tsukubensis NRRL18488]TAI45226.1 methyltransferase domain-containing protein [Streptomyces tsukubensis]
MSHTTKEAETMTFEESPETVAQALQHALLGDDLPDSFTLLGREWDLHRGVFPGTLSAATEVMASTVPYPKGGSFLEVGCGTGVISVTAALHGCASVTALDINDKAVANTIANAERHGVADRVRVLHSDMYTALGPGDRFDTIFWNVPWTYVEDDFSLSTDLHTAVFDPGYQGQARYITGAPEHLADGGRLLLGTADLGDRERLDALADGAGMRCELLHRVRRIEEVRVMEYHILELHPK